jgi:predicted DCC family thiol-disulfide oxidoreductase YuxK
MREQAIVYDGECRFCLWSVSRIERLDRQQQFEYLPRQSGEVEERFPFLADADFNTGLRLIVDRENVYVGADSVYQIYRRIPPFHLVVWLYRVPILYGFLRACYTFIARNRHRFGRVECSEGTCSTLKTASRI